MVTIGSGAAELLHQARTKERAACIPEAVQCYEGAISEAERAGEKAILSEALRRLAVVLHHKNESGRAREFCKRGFKVAVEIRNDILAAEALNTMGGLAVRMGDIEEAREHFRQALERGGHSRELRARVELNLGVLSNIRGELVNAVQHYERSVESYRATNDEHGSATAYVNLGIVHTDLRQYDWADSYFSKSLEIAERAGDAHLQGMCLVNHAEAHFFRGRYEEARRMSEAALAIFDQLDSRADKSEAYKMIGMVYRETGRPALAESRMRTAIELAVSAGSVLNEAEAARELALLMQAMGRNQDALTLLNTAHRLFGRLDARVARPVREARVVRLVLGVGPVGDGRHGVGRAVRDGASVERDGTAARRQPRAGGRPAARVRPDDRLAHDHQSGGAAEALVGASRPNRHGGAARHGIVVVPCPMCALR